MDNEMNVKLGLDTKDYTKSIDEALKVFNSFQTKLNDTKLGFSSSQVSELHKIFTDIRSTATSELAKIQKRIDSLNAKDVKLSFQYDTTSQKIEGLQKEIEITWNPTERAKLENRLDTLQQKLNALDGELTINDADLKEAETDYNFLLKELQVNPLEFDFESPSLIKFNTMIDNVLNGLKRTGEEAEDTGDKIDDMGKKAEGAARTSTKLNLMGRMFSQIKNTIAAAINPLNNFRKLWNNIIMTDDSKFGNTFKTIAANIQTALTPVFERIAQWIINLIGYINVFVKALSGGKTDLFAKTSKSAASTAKSMKEVNKQLAGFDEINDISESSGGSSSDGTENVGIVEPNLNGEWVKKLTEWGEEVGKVWTKITEFFTTLKDNIGTIGTIALALGSVVLVFVLLNKVLGNVTGPLLSIGVVLVGISTVLFGIANLMTVMQETGTSIGDLALIMVTTLGLLSVAVIAFAVAAKKIDLEGLAGLVVIFLGMVAVITVIKDLMVTMTKKGISATNMLATMGVVIGSIVVLIAALTIAAKLLQSPLAMGGMVVLAASISAILLVVAATLPTILDACGKFTQTVAPAIIAVITTINKGIENIIYAIGTVLPPIITAIGRNFQIVFSGIEAVVKSVGGVMDTIFNGIAKIILSVGTSICNILNTAKSLVTTVLSSILNFINQLGPAINNFVDNAIIAVTKLINFLISGIEYMVNTLVIDGVNGIIKGINSIGKYVGFTIGLVPRFTIPRFVPKLDVGTEYVPQDMLAYIHKGEAVIPKEFNERSYFSGTNNEETNRLLYEVIDAINNIEINPYTTVKDVGNASVQYIKDKSRQLGRSVI